MINIKLHDITVLDFNSIFNERIETELINDLDKYGLIKDGRINIKNKDVKRFFYHHIIHGLTTFFLESKIKNKCIIQYTTLAPAGKEILTMTDTPELQDFLNKTVIKISKLLPLKWYISADTFNCLARIIRKKSGNSSDVINRIKFSVDKYDISKFTYTKARTFARRYGLEFLTNNFFQKVYSKQLILS